MEIGSSTASIISSILSSVTRVADINGGYTVTNTVHEETGKGITSSSTVYTVYDKSAALELDSTPRYGINVDTYT